MDLAAAEVRQVAQMAPKEAAQSLLQLFPRSFW